MGQNFGPRPGGSATALNVTTTKVIKATPGTLYRVLVVAPGTTSGNLTINDCASVGAATAGNTIFTAAFGSLTVGQVLYLEWPCTVGIVISAVPSAGSPQYSISFS